MSTRNRDHVQQHMECKIYPEEDEELGRPTESAWGDSETDYGSKRNWTDQWPRLTRALRQT
jgi:hypothetical protein